MITWIIKRIRSWCLEAFPKYRTVEGRATTYEVANIMMRETANLPDPERWDIWPEREDKNRQIGVVYIRRRERVKE